MQLYNYLYIDNYSPLSIKYSKHKSTTSYTRNSQILPTTFVKTFTKINHRVYRCTVRQFGH